MKHHQQCEGKNDEWLTPQGIVKSLGEFDLDPCASANRPWDTARKHIALPADGLSAAWQGRVWCNPPFNRYARPKWMQKMAEHGNGILLVPAATETEAFYSWVWNKADAVCFIRTRPHFCYADGKRAPFNCGTAIVLVAYSKQNVEALLVSSLGKTLVLR